jgi:hypothetical protein
MKLRLPPKLVSFFLSWFSSTNHCCYWVYCNYKNILQHPVVHFILWVPTILYPYLIKISLLCEYQSACVFRGTWQKGSKGGGCSLYEYLECVSDVWSSRYYIYHACICIWWIGMFHKRCFHASRWEVVHPGKTKFEVWKEPEAHKGGQLASIFHSNNTQNFVNLLINTSTQLFIEYNNNLKMSFDNWVFLLKN